MPSHDALPGEIKRKKFIKALKRCGFTINTVGGDGSHYKAVWPRSGKTVTIPYDLPKQTLRYILKEIERCSGVTWEQVKENL